MEQFEKVIKALQLTKSNPIKNWDYSIEGFDGAMVHTNTALIDATLALINAQQERINELEAGQTAMVMKRDRNDLPIKLAMKDLAEVMEALEDLKAAWTARVMTLKDVDTAEDCMEPVFIEMLDENGKPGETPDIFSWRFVKHIMPLTDGKIYVLNNVGFSSALYEETYNKTWRCWSAKPTDEQREAVAWE